MELQICPLCGSTIESGKTVCGACGFVLAAPVRAPEPPESNEDRERQELLRQIALEEQWLQDFQRGRGEPERKEPQVDYTRSTLEERDDCQEAERRELLRQIALEEQRLQELQQERTQQYAPPAPAPKAPAAQGTLAQEELEPVGVPWGGPAYEDDWAAPAYEGETWAAGEAPGDGARAPADAGKLKNGKRILLAAAAVLVLVAAVLLATMVCWEHDWVEATCLEERTCSECGKTEGEALGHYWSAASCTTARSCDRCGIRDGEALGHVWVDATRTEPMTCSVCGLTQGERLKSESMYLNEMWPVEVYGKLYVNGMVPEGYPGYDWENIDKRVMDMKGNLYKCSVSVDASGPARELYMTYDLGGRFTTFTFTCATFYDSDHLGMTKYFDIICDGQEIQGPAMDATHGPVTRTIDVTGVQTMTIRYPATDGPNDIATVFDGLLTDE